MKSGRTPIKGIFQGIKWFWLQLVLPCIYIVIGLLKRFWRRIIKDKQFAIVFAITIALVLFSIVFGILPTSQNFEGNLLVRSLSFTCNESDRLLLKDIRNLQEITLSGVQKFTFTGTFNSPSHPELTKLNKLEIELINENSYLTITPTADFTLEELRLQEKTRIRNLKYASFGQRLSFTLQPSSNSSRPPIFLFSPSSNPIKITLSGYRLRNSPLSSDDTPLEFNLQTTQFSLQPNQSIEVTLQLPEDNEQPVFWRNIKVTNVNFERIIQTGNDTNDNIPESTIFSGDIRMARQEIKLEENQFLLVESPGVEILNQIEIARSDPSKNLGLKTTGDDIKISEPAKGLEVSVSGNTNSLQVGLNPRLPIARIQGSFLSRYVSNDIIVAIISFSAGLIVSLFSWLFNNFSDSPK